MYVVATPIGNLGDLSARAKDVLAGVDRILAEDTRHTRRLLAHFGLGTPLQALHEHNERGRVPALVDELVAGRSFALVSDAGTPLISDPGFPLVRGVRAAHIPVIAVAGPSSVIAALSVAGLPTDRFVFEGFLPAKAAARQERLARLAGETRTLVFMEAGSRLDNTLADIQMLFGADRPCALCRELTKQFEETLGEAVSDVRRALVEKPERFKGEFVLVLGGAAEAAADEAAAARTLGILLDVLPPSQAAQVASRLTGMPRKALYALALAARAPST